MKRHPNNPLITPDMIKPSAEGFRVRGAFNPGAIKFRDEYILLLRVAEDCLPEKDYISVPTIKIEKDGSSSPSMLKVKKNDPDVKLKDTRGIVFKGVDFLSTMSHIRLARSLNGIDFKVDDKPFLFASNPTNIFGVEDPRITFLNNKYYINYTCVSGDGWATALATTSDFKNIDHHGIIFPPQNKDVSIFPEKINGHYCALHRPNNSGFGKPSIWYAESPDLYSWGNHKCILRPRDTYWEKMKIGGGAPSIKTDQGWLQIYHAKGENQIYSLFTVLLDLEKPYKILKRSQKPLLIPETPYEKEAFFGNVLFTNGTIVEGKKIRIYYGAGDESCCLVEFAIDELFNNLSS